MTARHRGPFETDQTLISCLQRRLQTASANGTIAVSSMLPITHKPVRQFPQTTGEKKEK